MRLFSLLMTCRNIIHIAWIPTAGFKSPSTFAAAKHAFWLTAHSNGFSYHYGCAARSQARWQRSLMLPARPVCDWWRSALTAGWSPPGWLTGWPHRCAGPAACCHPSFSRFLPEGEREIQTRCHADKLTMSLQGRCPQTKSSSFSSLTSSQSFL